MKTYQTYLRQFYVQGAHVHGGGGGSRQVSPPGYLGQALVVHVLGSKLEWRDQLSQAQVVSSLRANELKWKNEKTKQNIFL